MDYLEKNALSLIIYFGTLLSAIVGGTWWLSKLESRVKALETAMGKHEARPHANDPVEKGVVRGMGKELERLNRTLGDTQATINKNQEKTEAKIDSVGEKSAAKIDEVKDLLINLKLKL